MNNVHSNQLKIVRDRSVFANEWLRSAKEKHSDGDVVGGFFAGYVSLVCSATQVVANHQLMGPRELSEDDDRWEGKAIELAFCEKRRDLMAYVISERGRAAVSNLSLREVPGQTSSRILNTSNDEVFRRVTDNLVQFWNPLRSRSWSDEDLRSHSADLAFLLRRIRNRLFHGEKMNDQHGDDADLLNRVNVVLFGIVEILLRH
jgi:hypothetical protein